MPFYHVFRIFKRRPSKWYNVNTSNESKIYDTEHLAKFFGVTNRTILTWCKKGKLPAFKIGKKWNVRVVDLRKMIDRKVTARKELVPPRLL